MIQFKSKDLYINLIYSFFSYALPTAFLQFVVQPVVASKIGAELNGQYLTLMSLNYFFIGITASVLNTVRLLQDEKYQKNNIKGDFNLILLIYLILLILVLPCGMFYYTKDINVLDVTLYLFIGVLYLYHDYIFAQYRLNLEYRKILINNILMLIGYVLGIYIFSHIYKWQIIYICAYLFTFFYDFHNTDFIKEPFKKTLLFKETFSILLLISISSLLGSALTYFDKLLLYPLLGGVSVSVYNTASLVGKILLLLSAPLSSVFLSYLVKENTLKNTFKIKHYLLITFIIIICYIICVVIGYPLTDYLYPKWSSQSHPLIPITVAASLFLLLSNCINTVLLRFFKTYLQIAIQGLHLIVYLALSLLGLRYFGLIGFCIGVAISNFVRFILIVTTLSIKPAQFIKIEEKGDI